MYSCASPLSTLPLHGRHVRESKVPFATLKNCQLQDNRTELPVLPVKGTHKGVKKSMISGCAVEHLLDKIAICLRSQLLVTDDCVSVSIQAQLPWIERRATFQTSVHQSLGGELMYGLHFSSYLRHAPKESLESWLPASTHGGIHATRARSAPFCVCINQTQAAPSTPSADPFARGLYVEAQDAPSAGCIRFIHLQLTLICLAAYRQSWTALCQVLLCIHNSTFKPAAA